MGTSEPKRGLGWRALETGAASTVLEERLPGP
jgi:hypothetical protein